jgi:hypothetical protein
MGILLVYLRAPYAFFNKIFTTYKKKLRSFESGALWVDDDTRKDLDFE